jgi:hypothetical protein
VPDPSSLPEPLAAHPPVRISDAEREAVVARLRQASTDGRLDLDEFADRVGEVYRSSTEADLERLVVDLPAPLPAVPARRPTRWTVGVFSSERRSGPWRPARPTRAWATFGSCRVDLADIECDDPEVELRATAFLGGIEVLVPEGAMVELAGFAVFGSKSCRVRMSAPRTGFPVVRVRARAVFGSVTVRNPRRPVP